MRNAILRLQAVLLCALVMSTEAGTSLAQSAPAAPAAPLDWFQRADKLANIRVPGAQPFHLKATFHAYEGIELLDKKQKSEMAVGDGVYEETWGAALVAQGSDAGGLSRRGGRVRAWTKDAGVVGV